MSYSEHRVPSPFQDEDKWFKLTKRQLALLLGGAVIDIVIVKFFMALKLLPLGIMIAVCILAVAGFCAIFVIPQDKYLFGAGLHIEVVLMRLVVKKFKEKKIYTKHCEEGEDS